MEKIILRGRGIVDGQAEGKALVCRETIQGWSGLDEKTGEIIEENHPLKGHTIKGKVLVLSGGKGSNGWSCHFHAARLEGFAPAALLFPKMDSRTAVASVVTEAPAAADFEEDIFEIISTGDYVTVNGNTGVVEIIKKLK